MKPLWTEHDIDVSNSELLELFETFRIYVSKMPPKLRSAIRGDDDPMSREVDQSDEGAILAPTENFGQVGSIPTVNERPLGGDPQMDDANTASDNSTLTPEESDPRSRRLGSGPTTYYDSEEVKGERQWTMETLRRDVINMVEEARSDNRLAMEEVKLCWKTTWLQ